MCKVLLVDADSTRASAEWAELLKSDYQVCVVADAAEALCAAEDWQPDVIVAERDCSLHGGAMFCAQLRQLPHASSTYLILRGSDRQAENVRRALELGSDAYLALDEDWSVLLAQIQAGMRIRQRQREAEERKSDEGVATLAVTLAHEINNPLTGILGYLSFLSEAIREMDRPDLEAMLTKVSAQAERIQAVIHNLRHLDQIRRTTYLDDISMLDLIQKSPAPPDHTR